MDNSKNRVGELKEIEEPTEYDESTWGKNIDGVYVIDGFKFKGKQSFRKAKEDLEKQLVKGAKGEINGAEFIVLDARLKGIEIEVDIQIIEKKQNRNRKQGGCHGKIIWT